jgi:hypothetical protein
MEMTAQLTPQLEIFPERIVSLAINGSTNGQVNPRIVEREL